MDYELSQSHFESFNFESLPLISSLFLLHETVRRFGTVYLPHITVLNCKIIQETHLNNLILVE